jgi:hypothetical protein
MEQLTLQLTGTTDLLMHAPRSVNPLDEGTKEFKRLTSKRKKSEDDHKVISRLEWELGLYHQAGVGPYIPGENVLKCLRDSGALTKQGAAINRAVVVMEQFLPLQCAAQNGGPRWSASSTSEQLWEANLKDYRRVGNQKNSVMRCRPWFPGWTLHVDLVVEESIIDVADVVIIAERAGAMIGLGDYRPRFGRFEVEVG